MYSTVPAWSCPRICRSWHEHGRCCLRVGVIVISLLSNDAVLLRITRLVHAVLLANQEHYITYII
jgi:hypothetical protein